MDVRNRELQQKTNTEVTFELHIVLFILISKRFAEYDRLNDQVKSAEMSKYEYQRNYAYIEQTALHEESLEIISNPVCLGQLIQAIRHSNRKQGVQDWPDVHSGQQGIEIIEGFPAAELKARRIQSVCSPRHGNWIRDANTVQASGKETEMCPKRREGIDEGKL